MKYTYYDGAGNKYKIDGLEISYVPVTKEESSSGNYDGGNPYTKQLVKSELIALVSAFERAIWDKSDHADKREMGSGLLIKDSDNEDRVQVILKYKSTSNQETLSLLRAI